MTQIEKMMWFSLLLTVVFTAGAVALIVWIVQTITDKM